MMSFTCLQARSEMMVQAEVGMLESRRMTTENGDTQVSNTVTVTAFTALNAILLPTSRCLQGSAFAAI